MLTDLSVFYTLQTHKNKQNPAFIYCHLYQDIIPNENETWSLSSSVACMRQVPQREKTDSHTNQHSELTYSLTLVQQILKVIMQTDREFPEACSCINIVQSFGPKLYRDRL